MQSPTSCGSMPAARIISSTLREVLPAGALVARLAREYDAARAGLGIAPGQGSANAAPAA